MGRKDVIHRTEGAVADLPAVKVRGVALRGRWLRAQSPLARQPLVHLQLARWQWVVSESATPQLRS